METTCRVLEDDISAQKQWNDALLPRTAVTLHLAESCRASVVVSAACSHAHSWNLLLAGHLHLDCSKLLYVYVYIGNRPKLAGSTHCDIRSLNYSLVGVHLAHCIHSNRFTVPLSCNQGCSKNFSPGGLKIKGRGHTRSKWPMRECAFSWSGAGCPPHRLGERCKLPQLDLGAEPRTPRVFLHFIDAMAIFLASDHVPAVKSTVAE